MALWPEGQLAVFGKVMFFWRRRDKQQQDLLRLSAYTQIWMD